MKFEPADRAQLAKIGVTSLLDLALCLPKSFEDTTLSQEPREGRVCAGVELTNVARARGGILSATAFCKEWNTGLKIVIFNAKAWHFGAFKRGKEMIISGVCSRAFGGWQVINPKIITKTGEILPRYKSALKDDALKKLIAKYVNLGALINEGLRENEAKFLTDLQESNENSVRILALLKAQISGRSENLGMDKIAEISSENFSGRNFELKSGLEILKFVEIFNYLKKLNSKKTHFNSEKVEIFDISDWLKTLPFTPTNDQLNAISDIRSDLLGDEAKRRVVMGDVGSGKTLVILAAALMIYPKTAVLMAPTSILAEQIYGEAARLLPSFVCVRLVKSGDKNVDFTGVNLIVGTHALLYQDLPASPLVMVDEQHRFGSNQRGRIEEMVSSPQFRANFVQFSATPIPRTLSLIQSALVEFSFLRETPFVKRIHSQILKSENFGALISHLRAQISQGKQAIIVYPLVENSENFHYQSLNEAQGFWLENFKNVFITHGKDREKERVLREFRQGGDLLLSTTVVEVGISLPRLSTIVIVGAERLGLATLHQLRGRVGRNGGEGWCFLFTKLKNPPERLREFCATTDGFKIAQIDLKNRQSGDILDGTLQHGATFEYYDYDEEITRLARSRV